MKLVIDAIYIFTAIGWVCFSIALCRELKKDQDQ